MKAPSRPARIGDHRCHPRPGRLPRRCSAWTTLSSGHIMYTAHGRTLQTSETPDYRRCGRAAGWWRRAPQRVGWIGGCRRERAFDSRHTLLPLLGVAPECSAWYACRFRNAIGIFMNQVLHDLPMTIFGDGKQTRVRTHRGMTRPFTRPFTRPCTRPFTTATHTSIHTSIHMAIHTAVHTVIHTTIHTSMHKSIHTLAMHRTAFTDRIHPDPAGPPRRIIPHHIATRRIAPHRTTPQLAAPHHAASLLRTSQGFSYIDDVAPAIAVAPEIPKARNEVHSAPWPCDRLPSTRASHYRAAAPAPVCCRR